MFRHMVKICALLLGLEMLAAAKVGRPLLTDKGRECKEVRPLLEDLLRLQEERILAALRPALFLHEQRISTAFRDALRLQRQETAAALQEAMVLQVELLLQERDRVSTPQAPSATLTWPSTSTIPSLSPAPSSAPSSAPSPAPSSAPSTTPSSAPSTAPSTAPSSTSSSAPSPAPSVVPSNDLSTSERQPAAPAPPPVSATSAHDQQAERMRVKERIEETKARRNRARHQPFSLERKLYDAAENGSLHEVQRLLEEGADVNCTDKGYGRSPLIAAAFSDRCSSEVISLLLSRGADVNAVDASAWSALHVAAMRGNAVDVSMLLGAGAEVDARNENGETPLHQAAFFDREAAARALLAAGARKDLKAWSRGWEGKTPLDLADSEELWNLLRP